MGPIRRRLVDELQQEPRPLALLDGNITVQVPLRLERLLEPLAMALPALTVRHEANVPLESSPQKYDQTLESHQAVQQKTYRSQT